MLLSYLGCGRLVVLSFHAAQLRANSVCGHKFCILSQVTAWVSEDYSKLRSSELLYIHVAGDRPKVSDISSNVITSTVGRNMLE